MSQSSAPDSVTHTTHARARTPVHVKHAKYAVCINIMRHAICMFDDALQNDGRPGVLSWSLRHRVDGV